VVAVFMSVGIGFFVGWVVINAGTLKNFLAGVNRIFQKYFWPVMPLLAPNVHACEDHGVGSGGDVEQQQASSSRRRRGDPGRRCADVPRGTNPRRRRSWRRRRGAWPAMGCQGRIDDAGACVLVARMAGAYVRRCAYARTRIPAAPPPAPTRAR
jgi:hypothetical protein